MSHCAVILFWVITKIVLSCASNALSNATHVRPQFIVQSASQATILSITLALKAAHFATSEIHSPLVVKSVPMIASTAKLMAHALRVIQLMTSVSSMPKLFAVLLSLGTSIIILVFVWLVRRTAVSANQRICAFPAGITHF